ncbi:hypothetical protein [Roseobacter sinensis]|uniref:Uncharacterized protein n=1 Tax=Roseobacter sinensis TaxID=2931391 RepID=A0ABT3BCG4_9RHOB|nr:hypothetical protein [Roseobacter sp. WL0113]MCV3271261.1 hypothetical protein [Roseobacter sp. WL0113]
MDGNPSDQLSFLLVSFRLIILSNTVMLLWIIYRCQSAFDGNSFLTRLRSAFSPPNRGPIIGRAVAVTAIHGIFGVAAMFIAVVLI